MFAYKKHSADPLLLVLQALHSPEQQKSRAAPEELVRCTKSITVATAKAVAAGNSCKQDDVIVAANMGRKAISDMLTICKVLHPKL
jgi:talin